MIISVIYPPVNIAVRAADGHIRLVFQTRALARAVGLDGDLHAGANVSQFGTSSVQTANNYQSDRNPRMEVWMNDLRARGELQVARWLVRSSVIAADVVGALGVEGVVARKQRATGRFGRASKPIDGNHFVAIGSIYCIGTKLWYLLSNSKLIEWINRFTRNLAFEVRKDSSKCCHPSRKLLV